MPRLEALLGEEVLGRLVPGRVEVDVASASETEVAGAIAALVEDDDRRAEREALDRMAAGIGSGGRGVGGPADTVAALNERRVETLLLEPDFDGSAQRCPACGLLVLDGAGLCPADGTQLEAVEHLREAAVEAALARTPRSWSSTTTQTSARFRASAPSCASSLVSGPASRNVRVGTLTIPALVAAGVYAPLS